MPTVATDRRDNFLVEMYRQMSVHLNRHILLSWQPIGVVAGALAVFVLGDKLDSSAGARLDFAITIVVLLCAWSIAHVHDANNWFKRNLHIITNIERQFLRQSDRREIHFFFAKHRDERSSKKRLVAHFRIQWAMVAFLWIILIGYHFYQRVLPDFGSTLDHFEFVRSIPYLVSVICVVCCYWFARSRAEDYADLEKESPGQEVPSDPRNKGDGT
jgi:hypothetical protein